MFACVQPMVFERPSPDPPIMLAHAGTTADEWVECGWDVPAAAVQHRTLLGVQLCCAVIPSVTATAASTGGSGGSPVSFQGDIGKPANRTLPVHRWGAALVCITRLTLCAVPSCSLLTRLTTFHRDDMRKTGSSLLHAQQSVSGNFAVIPQVSSAS